MHESNWASLWLPVNWVTQLVIVSDHQTNSHSYVSALAPFSSGAVPLRPLKAKEPTGQGFKPISSFSTAAITTGGGGGNSLCHPPSEEGLIRVGCTSGFFSRGDTRVTVKNSHQVACHFPVVLVKVVFAYYRTVSRSRGEHLVSVVKPDFKRAFISGDKEKRIFFFFQLDFSVTRGDKTCATSIEMQCQVWIIACTT